VNNDLNEDQSTPVNKESLVECEIQKDTEISSCLQNKGMYLNYLSFFMYLFIYFEYLVFCTFAYNNKNNNINNNL
jgi:hypothetical protein